MSQQRSQENTNGDIDASVFRKILNKIRLSVTEEYEYPPAVLKIDDITVATFGNFSASTGKTKSKKTFNVSAIVAALLSDRTVLRYKGFLPAQKNRILYFDTEQSKYHCHKVMKRILKLSGMPMDADTSRLEFFMLREYSPRQRCQIIEEALKANTNVGFIVIDGLRDLLYDINNSTESVELINNLMRWSSAYNIHIHTVLHLNKGDDNTRGHVGTEMNNKAECIIQLIKSAFDSRISMVKAMHIREQEFDPFSFKINEEALPELVENVSVETERKPLLEVLNDEQHKSALEIVFSEGDITGYKEMLKALQGAYASIGYKRGRNVCVELNKYLINRGIITKKDKSYSYCSSAFEDDAENEKKKQV